MVEQELQDEYKAGPIDSVIVSTLQSMDKRSFGVKDKILFFKELAYLLGGGVSFMQALDLIGDTSTNYAIKEIAKTIATFVHQGKTLSYSLNRLPDYFDQGDYSIVKAGEASGNLPQVLQSLAQEYVYTKDIKDKYIGALIYPTMLIIIAIVAVFGLFLLVLPNIFSIASSFNGLKLPWITQALRDISTFFQNQWKLMFGILVWLSLVGWVFFSSDAGKKSRFQILLNIPLVGKMTKYFYLVRRCRYMKLLLNSGLSYVQTFKLLKDILGIPAYQSMISRVLEGLNKGDSIYNSLKEETDLIPADVSVMIKVGEETANLSNSLDNVLHMYESDLNNLISRLAKVIEPIMLIFVGGIVVVIALGIFWLILQIMQGAGM